MQKNLDYKADLLADLRNDLGYAAKYLSAAIADSKEAFLVALRDVAEAQKGIAQVATEAKVNRENLYRILSEAGNPRLATLLPVLSTLRLRIAVEPEQPVPSVTFLGIESRSGARISTSGNVFESLITETTTWGVTTTFTGTLLGRTWDRDHDLPIFEAPEVPLHLLAEERTSEGLAQI